ncbi:amidohydrolase [Glaciimonas immobilis]|uniref:Amidohydrolase 3 domain-containing protein n=1 Tax=Glaciimonas immobilis TaxID=728004 RepID=A0A840RNT9_9BURK|nr:amidohydrolase [Glaciimonas immobilis]KAF3998916.1 amidohydrolase [Glaciimonas immobilis]MBB5198320.1 hypothetical protein [Glaciimonas immobilis]
MNSSQPEATCVAVREGKILSVGSLEEVSLWGEVDVDITFRDKILMPGLVEGHSHLMEGAMWDAVYVGFYDRRGPDGKCWKGLTTLDQVIQRLTEAEKVMTDACAELLGWGFDPIFFGTARLSAKELDTVSAVRPIAILHASVHLMNVNSAMLSLAGIDEDSEIDGIHKDADGRPSGELQEFAAMFPVYRLIGKQLAISSSEKENTIWNFGKVAQLAGVTTATDLLNDLSATGTENLRKITSDENYPVRIVPAYGPQRSAENGLKRLQDAIAENSQKLHYGAVKVIVDGSIQGFTARVKWPGYFNGKENGLWIIPPSQFVELFTPFHIHGLQLHIHTNGDEAVELVLNAFEKILAKHPRRDHRHTLQHCQMADAAQLRRIAALGLCINFFSNHIYYWGDAHYTQTMGPDRAHRMNAAASALRLGIPIAFHSDAPITQLSPLFTAWCAVQRKTSSGHVLGENERISVAQALHAITLGAAYTLKMDHLVGSIEVGKFADFAVLEQDPTQIDPDHLKDIPVWGTVLGGKIFKSPK